jgi:5'-nucleotidase (lipoprotein e(P4) family)
MRSPSRTLSLVAACSAASLLAGFAFGNVRLATAQAPVAAAPALNPQEKALYANLYMQTSAEYRAVCTQTYALATTQLRQRLASIPVEETKRPAVVMDLDETVLDNGGYETFVDRERMNFTPATWSEWEKNHADEVIPIPGAKEFIQYAEQNGVAVVYLSNRAEANRAGTIAALKANGLDTTGIEDRLLLQAAGTPSDKSARRKAAMEKYRVVMLVGDNLRDFSEEFAAPKIAGSEDAKLHTAIEERKAKVDATRNHWGVDWFILPNPDYGEWEKLLGDNPRTKLRPTRMPMASQIK